MSNNLKPINWDIHRNAEGHIDLISAFKEALGDVVDPSFTPDNNYALGFLERVGVQPISSRQTAQLAIVQAMTFDFMMATMATAINTLSEGILTSINDLSAKIGELSAVKSDTPLH